MPRFSMEILNPRGVEDSSPATQNETSNDPTVTLGNLHVSQLSQVSSITPTSVSGADSSQLSRQ